MTIRILYELLIQELSSEVDSWLKQNTFNSHDFWPDKIVRFLLADNCLKVYAIKFYQNFVKGIFFFYTLQCNYKIHAQFRPVFGIEVKIDTQHLCELNAHRKLELQSTKLLMIQN